MSILDTYLSITQALLQNPVPSNPLYTTAQLTQWINIARGQIAGEGACIHILAPLAVTAGTREYLFGQIDLTNALGVGGVIRVEQALVKIGDGMSWLQPRPFQWFTYYNLNNVVPRTGRPAEWSQVGQGASYTLPIDPEGGTVQGGTLLLDPVPDSDYTLQIDCICYPGDLIESSSPPPGSGVNTVYEAIPYMWQDAVPYFAAYMALLSAQASNRQADAQRMFDRYKEFMSRARSFATPATLSYQNPQTSDPTKMNQLGMSTRSGGA
jgi:hypothetical protein